MLGDQFFESKGYEDLDLQYSPMSPKDNRKVLIEGEDEEYTIPDWLTYSFPVFWDLNSL